MSSRVEVAAFAEEALDDEPPPPPPPPTQQQQQQQQQKTTKKKKRKSGTKPQRQPLCLRARARVLCRIMELRISITRYFLQESQYMDRVRSRVALSLAAFEESGEWKYGKKVLSALDASIPRSIHTLFDSSSSSAAALPFDALEVTLVCRAAATVLVEEVGSVAVDKGAKVALVLKEDGLVCRADVPALYCVAAKGDASVHVADLDLSVAKDKRRLRASRVELRLDDLDDLAPFLSSSSSGVLLSLLLSGF